MERTETRPTYTSGASMLVWKSVADKSLVSSEAYAVSQPRVLVSGIISEYRDHPNRLGIHTASPTSRDHHLVLTRKRKTLCLAPAPPEGKKGALCSHTRESLSLSAVPSGGSSNLGHLGETKESEHLSTAHSPTCICIDELMSCITGPLKE